MEQVIIYTHSEERPSAETLSANLQSIGLDSRLVELNGDPAVHEEIDTVAGDIPVEQRYPLVRVGVPKIRALLWRPQPADVVRLLSGDAEPIDRSSRRVTVFSATWCPDCVRLKRYLNENAVDASELNIEESDEAAAWVIRRSGGRRVVPSVLVDDHIALFNPQPQVLGRLLGVE